MLHEYDRQWASATGHGVRHPLRLKMTVLQAWCDETVTPDEFEARLVEVRAQPVAPAAGDSVSRKS